MSATTGRRGKYRLADGTVVPGVTTILGRFKDPGGLMHWANKVGLEGKELRDEQDRVSQEGTEAHELIREYLMKDKEEQGRMLSMPTVVDEVVVPSRVALHSFAMWCNRTRIKAVSVETPMVSERHRFGGTMDASAVVLIDGRVAIVEWKTTGDVYVEHLAQLAAYGILWKEAFSQHVEEYHVVRPSRRNIGSCDHRMYSDMGAAREYFLCLRRAYDLRAEVEQCMK